MNSVANVALDELELRFLIVVDEIIKNDIDALAPLELLGDVDAEISASARDQNCWH